MPIIPVTIPDVWGEDKDQEGTLVNWFYQEGSRVEAGEVLAEGMVEKVTFEITAPASGILVRILAPENTPIRPGTVVAELETEG